MDGVGTGHGSTLHGAGETRVAPPRAPGGGRVGLTRPVPCRRWKDHSGNDDNDGGQAAHAHEVTARYKLVKDFCFRF